MNAVIKFYSQGGRSKDGYTLEEILKWPDHRLQTRSNYMLWVFPEQTEASMKTNARKVFSRFLNFYGFEYENNKLRQIKSIKREENGVLIGLYNIDSIPRLTKVLRFFVSVGLPHFSAIFFLMLCQVMKESPDFKALAQKEIDNWLDTQKYLSFEDAKKAIFPLEEAIIEPQLLQKETEVVRASNIKSTEQPLEPENEGETDAILVAQSFLQQQKVEVKPRINPPDPKVQMEAEIKAFQKANPGMELEGSNIEEQYKFLKQMLQAEEDIELEIFLEKERKQVEENKKRQVEQARNEAEKQGYVGTKHKPKKTQDNALTNVPIFNYTRKDISRALDQVSAYGGMEDLQGKQATLLSMSKGDLGTINLKKFVQLKNSERSIYKY